jgi:hypothetical protein
MTAAAALSLIVGASSLAYADGMPPYQGSGYAPFSWTGFYIGGNAGYGWDDDRHQIALTNNFGATITTPGLESEGGFAGGQLGYNWQRGTCSWASRRISKPQMLMTAFQGALSMVSTSTPDSASTTSARSAVGSASLSIVCWCM